MKAAWHVPTLAAALLLSSVAAQAATAPVPRAVVTDNARDAKHPAANRQVLIPSGGAGMNALFFLAAGSGLKPTLLLLHGLPGNEQNLDLAQAIRRAGWNVLTMHYRGSWGSPGAFSIAGAVDDAEAAMAFLRQPENAAKYGIDSRRILIGGHSMGGFAAARYAAAHQDVAGVVLIDAWNVGADGKDLRAHPERRAAAIAEIGDDLGNSLAGTDAAHLAAEVEHHAEDWDLLALAPALATHPALVIGATHGGGASNKALADAIRAQRKGKVSSLTLDSDHSFADHRIALSAAVVDWLQRARAAGSRRDPGVVGKTRVQLHGARRESLVRRRRAHAGQRTVDVSSAAAGVQYATIAGDLYMFPRSDGILLGGTHEEGVWSLAPNLRRKAELLAAHKAFFDGFRG